MIDIHAHMCFDDYERDNEKIISQARKEGMTAIIASSARYEEGLKVLELAKKHPGFIFPTLGHHPTEGDDFGKVLDLIEKSNDKIVGVGEVGLDFHWEKDPSKREKQKEVFERFISLAEGLRKPIVIHSWDAERECFDMVKDRKANCLFHCYSGDASLAREIVDRGFIVSFSTQVLFSKNIRKNAKTVPLESMTLETDAPFLDPDRERRKNVPWNIKLSAAKIAEIKGVATEEVIRKTTENAVRFFGLKI